MLTIASHTFYVKLFVSYSTPLFCYSLTLAFPRGIGVTLMTKGGGAKWPFKMDRLYEFAQRFSMFDLFFHIVYCIRKPIPQKIGLYLL